MELSELIRQLSAYKKEYDAVVKLLQEILRLDTDREKNLAQIKSKIDKLSKAVEKLDSNFLHKDSYLTWTREYREILVATEESYKRRFGSELSAALTAKGYSLSGQYPLLRAGLFTLQLDFGKDTAVLWYGPRQEKLDTCHLAVAQVVECLEKCRETLGSKLEPSDFMALLHNAYLRLEGGRKKEDVAITSVLPEIAFLLQNPSFQQNPRRENFVNYTRADFSFDLYRFRFKNSGERPLFEKKLHLRSTTLSSTASRKTFLWIPSDDEGNGSTYSQMRFEEE